MIRVQLASLSIAVICLSSSAPCGSMDRWFQKPDAEDRWEIPAEDEPVVGNQNWWYVTPHDLRLGDFGMSAGEGSLANVTEKHFELRPNNVWGHYTYRVTLKGEDAPATGFEPRNRPFAHSREIAFAEVAKLPDAEKGLLMSGTVTQIDDDRRGFDAGVQFGGRTVPCRFELLKVEREKRIPEIHSRLYGPHWRHAFDVYYPEGFRPDEDGPAPVLLNIHGGGWGALDKQSTDGDRWNEHGIVYISINYRYLSGYEQQPAMTVPIAAPLLDAARCIQHIKYHARELGIDPNRICLTGGSAGGASSAWLAMHDDMADPDSEDPIARMSTRVHCAAPVQAQTSMDPQQMRDWIPEITYGPDKFIRDFPSGIGRDKEQRFEYWLSQREKFLPAIKEFSAYEHASGDDPPMMICYGGQEDIPVSEGGNATHHPKFGEHLHERLQQLGVESYYWCDNVACDLPRYNGWAGFSRFILDKLLGPDWEQNENTKG